MYTSDNEGNPSSLKTIGREPGLGFEREMRNEE